MKSRENIPGARDDIHSHLLPGWDDGAKNLEQALALAQLAAAAGIRRMVATPHVTLPSPSHQRPPSAIPAATEAFQKALITQGLDLEVIPGAELTLSGELLEQVPTEPWLTIGGQGRYVLGMAVVPGQLWPAFLDELIFRLLLIGVIPIICHPERLSAVQSNPETLRGAVARGARLQITAGSLSRPANSAIRTCAHRLLRAGLVSLVASDVHGPEDIFPSQVASELARIVGSEAAQRILVDNPARVLGGEEIPAPESPLDRRRTFSFLRRLVRAGSRGAARKAQTTEVAR